MQDLQNIRRLAVSLRQNLAKCASGPDVAAVHDTRTGTRRLEAMLENILRELPEAEQAAAIRDAIAAALQILRKIRRAAGKVRDLDVHRKLLSKLEKRALGTSDGNGKRESAADSGDGQPPQSLTRPATQPLTRLDALEFPQAGLCAVDFSSQTDRLDAWLKHRRTGQAHKLQAQAPGALVTFDKRIEALETALRTKGLRRRKRAPAVVALENFARLASEMQSLHAGNLHDFRKGAKKARYVAELAAGFDAEAAQVGDALKKLQDEIGDWHDWLVLAEEAREALAGDAAELIALIQQERDRHFSAAIRTAAKLRGRLLGEYLAVTRTPVRRRRTSPQPRSTSRRRTST